MHTIHQLLLTLALVLSSIVAIGQTAATTYTFAAGEVLDIILFTQQPNSDSTLKVFFQQAFPIAKQHGYRQQPSFGIARPHLAGNYQPETLVFGTWPNLDQRAAALAQLEADLPDFHYLRRANWSSFNMTYWPLAEDVSFDINPSTYTVVTAYWTRPEADADYLTERTRALTAAGGQTLVQLHDGTSPPGYRYAPDYLTIMSWPNESAYQTALSTLPKLDDAQVAQIHAFARR